MKSSRAIARTVPLVLALLAPLAAHATLTAVTQDGGAMVSDSVLNVTWADVASPSGLTWSPTAATGSVQAWIASLNAEDYGGFNDWTLATGDGTFTAGSTNCTNNWAPNSSHFGCGASTSTTNNQLDNLFINELGNVAGDGITITGPFTHLSTTTNYWSSSPFSGGSTWQFDTSFGYEFGAGTANGGEGLAVRAGQVSTVPLPASAWLLLGGLGLIGVLARARPGAPMTV